MSASAPDKINRWWRNHSCKFTTDNGDETKKNSRYTVTEDSLKRIKDVGKDKLKVSTHANHHVCYFDGTTDELLLMIMHPTNEQEKSYGKRLKISKEKVKLQITIGCDENQLINTTEFYLKPRVGLCVFDFTLESDFRLSKRHPGHIINRVMEN